MKPVLRKPSHAATEEVATITSIVLNGVVEDVILDDDDRAIATLIKHS